MAPLVTRRAFVASAAATSAFACLGKSALWGKSANDTPVVVTQYGKVTGRSIGDVKLFLGMPYGGDCSGANRFLPPSPPTPWKDVRACVKVGDRAYQKSSLDAEWLKTDGFSYGIGGRADGMEAIMGPCSENCLSLNVSTPGFSGNRPVMVYIHGGGFAIGGGGITSIGDRLVAEQDVVLVGINHRLNVFGYTYLGGISPKFPDSGNVGQLDLIAALQWVKNNISRFGGDPSNVTIFGESGGGGKVSTLMAMPAAKGLFRRAIVESGSMLKVRTTDEASEHTQKLFKALGLTTAQVSEFQSLPAEKLYEANESNRMFGGPVVDGRSIPHQTWDPTAPAEAAGVSLLVGNCKDESTGFALFSNPELFSLNWDSLKQAVLKRGIPEPVTEEVIAAYRKDFPSESPSDIYFRLSADQGARRNAITQAERQLSQAKTYMYHFDWNTPVENGKLRAFHVAELALVFRLVKYPESDPLSRQLAGAWAAFARTGSPNTKGLPEWEPYSLEKRATMTFDVNNTRVINDPVSAQLRLMKPYPGGLL